MRSVANRARSWPVVVLLLLVPLWCVGLFGRNSYWTPDEPREADIAWRMSQQQNRALPMLAEQPFLEKPPLTYWMSGAAIAAFGAAPAIARLPNLLYASLAALAVGCLGFAAAGNRGAIVAALAFGSSFLVYRSLIWLAPDAALLAGISIALLGVYTGFTSPPGRRKLTGYLLMHAGAAIGFMAKSAPGWLVPAIALIALALWERRGSELLRWELYAGFALQALLIGPWLLAVAADPHGTEALRVLFWNNLVGRFVHVDAPLALQYADGHPNYLGKYWLELPIYLLPWSLLLLVAARRAWRAVREPSESRAAWRFAVVACVPWLLLLSLSTTARDIYAGPAVVGAALLIALWATERDALPAADRWAVRGTVVLVVAIASVIVLGLIAFAAAAAMHKQPATSRALAAVTLVLPLGVIVSVGRGGTNAHQSIHGLDRAFVAYFATIVIGAAELMHALTPWYDLPRIASAIHQDVTGSPCALLQPDETTIAMLDYQLDTRCTLLRGREQESTALATNWLEQHGARARLVVKLPGRAPGEVSALLGTLGMRQKAPSDGLAGDLVRDRIARIERRYETPHGRRYVVLALPTDAPDRALAADVKSDASFPR